MSIERKKLANVEKSKVLAKRVEKKLGEKKWRVKKEECVRKRKDKETI